MGKLVTALGFFCIGLTPSFGATTIGAKDWVLKQVGSYHIDVARSGGKEKHPDDSDAGADVTAETDEGVLTFPFCPPDGGGCLPGYVFLAYANTTVTRSTLADGSVVDTITVDDSGRKLKYTWTERAGVITFRNPYLVHNGREILVEYTVRKIP